MLALLLLPVSLILAAVAEYALRVKMAPGVGLAAAVTAVVVAGLSSRIGPEQKPMAGPLASSDRWPGWRPDRPAAAWSGLAALGAALALHFAGRAYSLQVVLWVGAVVACNLVYRQRQGAGIGLERRDLYLLGGLLLFSSLVRLGYLGEIPGGLYGDEAVYGKVAGEVLGANPPAPFSGSVSFTPSLWFWLQAPGLWLAGRDVAGLRLIPALGASFAVLPVFLMLRREAGRSAAFAAALLLACSPLHVHMSRIAVSEAWVAMLVPASMAALYLALRFADRAAAVSLASTVGLCFFLGNKFVLLPAVLAGGALALLLVGAARRWLPLLALTAGVASLLVVPQILHYSATGFFGPLVSHPMRWMQGGPEFELGPRLFEVARLFLDGREMSPFSAGAVRHILPAAESALFLVGLGLALGRPRRPLHAFLLGWLAAGMASLLLDPEPNQLFHLIAVASLPALFGALAIGGVARAGSIAPGTGIARRRLAAAAAVALTVTVASGGLWSYFVGNAGRWRGAEFTALGRAMNELAPGHQLVLVTRPMSWDLNSTLNYLAPGVRAENKWPELPETDPWPLDSGRDVAFIFEYRRIQLLGEVRRRYPGGVLSERRGFSGEPLVSVYRVSAAEIAERASARLPP